MMKLVIVNGLVCFVAIPASAAAVLLFLFFVPMLIAGADSFYQTFRETAAFGWALGAIGGLFLFVAAYIKGEQMCGGPGTEYEL